MIQRQRAHEQNEEEEKRKGAIEREMESGSEDFVFRTIPPIEEQSEYTHSREKYDHTDGTEREECVWGHDNNTNQGKATCHNTER